MRVIKPPRTQSPTPGKDPPTCSRRDWLGTFFLADKGQLGVLSNFSRDPVPPALPARPVEWTLSRDPAATPTWGKGWAIGSITKLWVAQLTRPCGPSGRHSSESVQASLDLMEHTAVVLVERISTRVSTRLCGWPMARWASFLFLLGWEQSFMQQTSPAGTAAALAPTWASDYLGLLGDPDPSSTLSRRWRRGGRPFAVTAVAVADLWPVHVAQRNANGRGKR